jgi:putative copper export protein
MIDPIILVRGVHLAATALASGTVAFLALICAPEPPLRRRLLAMTRLAFAAAILSCALWLLLLAGDLTGEPFPAASGAWTLLTETRFGTVAITRLLLSLASAALLAWPRMIWFALAAATGFVGLLALVGHAGATPGAVGDLQLAGDVAHLLAAGAWVGGLPALAMLLAEARAKPALRPDAAAAVYCFGQLGLICVAVLLASGLFNAWNLLAGARDLLTTPYGQLLAAKLVLVAGMIAIAAVNRYRLTAHAADALPQLQRNSLAETALGLGVLLLVGALGTFQPGAHRHTADAIPADAAFVHIHDIGAMADVTIEPGRVGTASATIRVSREDGTELAAKSVRFGFDPRNTAVQSAPRMAERQTDGSWLVPRLNLGGPGVWTVRVIVTPEAGTPLLLDAPVEIGP